MKIRNAVPGFLLLAGISTSAHAQSVGKMLGDDFTHAAKDMVAVWGSPFDAHGHDWLLTTATFGAFGLSMVADQSVSDWALRNDSSALFRAIKPVRRGGKLFSGKYVVPPVAVVYVIGVATRNQGLRDAVTGCMTSWGAQSAVRKVLYLLVGRARPSISPDDPQRWSFAPGNDWDMHSFPAGHFANAMACATFGNKRFHLGPAGVLAYGLAGAVGLGRFADGAHWMSDTVLGGILGYAVGHEVARRSLKRDRARAASSAALYMAPTSSGYEMGFRWSF